MTCYFAKMRPTQNIIILLVYAKQEMNESLMCHIPFCLIPALSSNGNRFPYQNTHYRKPLNEGVTSPTTTTSSGRPEVYTSMRNVVCYVGKKGRRIVFLSVRPDIFRETMFEFS